MRTSLRFAAAAAIAAAFASSAMAADLKVGLVTSLSGPGASIGIPYQKGMLAAEAYMPEIAGHKVQVTILDDGSDPTAAGRNARKLVEEDKVDVLIGSASVPALIAVSQVGRDAKTPIVGVAPINADPTVVPWLVTDAQPVPLMVRAVVERMKQNKVKTVGYIGYSDAWGDLVYSALMQAAGPNGIKVVTNERYARADSSVTGQVLRIMSLHPDAVMDGGSGTPGALPLLTLAERGYRGGIYGSHALINPDFIRVGGKAVEGLTAVTGPVVVAEQLPDSYPTKKIALAFRAAYQKANGAPATDAFSAYAFDAWLIIADAAKRVGSKAQPGTPEYRLALRDAIKSAKELVGTHGVYNFKPNDVNGVDNRSRVIVKLEKGTWKLSQ